MKIMIDTNVIIDVYQNRAGFAENSGKILKLSENRKLTGFITASTITDIYYILGRHIKDREQLKQLVQKLLTAVTLADVLANDVTGSFAMAMPGFEDALLAQCAKRLRADYIVTRNPKDFKDAPIPPITPDIFLEEMYS
jgi:predicted nucleic acid-binding protein